jgi:hypothetical protein
MSRFQNPRCSGCYPVFQPNQQAHPDFGGCMEIKYDFEEEEEEEMEQEKEQKEEQTHPYFQDRSFMKRIKKIGSHEEQTNVLEVMTDLLKEQPDIHLKCLLAIIDKLVDPSISYIDISSATYMWGVEVWNCFIMNAYIEWQKSGQNDSKKIYPFELLISHTHLVY